MAEIANIIKKIATEGQKIHTYPAKVIRVNRDENVLHPENEDAYSVDVMRADGAEISHVRLKASVQDKEQGVICVPKINSWVLVSIIETTETRAFISQYSEIDKIFLRIKREDDTFFQVQSNGNATALLFKTIASPGNPPTYKDISSLSFSENELKIDFDNGEGYQASVKKDVVQFTRGNLNFELTDDDKFRIAAGNKNIKTELDALIDEISKIVVVQGTSPNVGALMTIKNNIDSILKED